MTLQKKSHVVLYWYLIWYGSMCVANSVPAKVVATESLSADSKGIQSWSAEDVLKALWQSQHMATAAVERAIPAIASASEAVANHLADSRSRIAYVGAGSSGLLAMQDAMELTPTFGIPIERIVFLMAGGDSARLVPLGPEEDNAQSAEADIARAALTEHDVVIGVAASGTTPYTVRMMELARGAGALTIAIANNPGTSLLNGADFPILIETGAEVVAGSTRLAAGTAQKVVLGMLSTAVMTRLGHVIDGHMVSLIADNEKLIARGVRIVSDIANVTEQQAHQALSNADGDVKSAVLIALGQTAEKARDCLARENGNLRAVLDNMN
jgi:N-acetylmuramic acid 6-phosphate etherase